MAGITESEALRLLKDSSKLTHSVLVQRLMEITARRFQANSREWAIVGLLHDLDYDLVTDDMTSHGHKTAEILNGKLSETCLHAIRSHDYRSGVKPVTLLDRALVFADNLAVLIEDQDIKTPCTPSTFFEALRRECKDRPWVGENLLKFAEREGMTIHDVINEIRNHII